MSANGAGLSCDLGEAGATKSMKYCGEGQRLGYQSQQPEWGMGRKCFGTGQRGNDQLLSAVMTSRY